MTPLHRVKGDLREAIQAHFDLTPKQAKQIQIELNVDKSNTFGDLSTNASLVLAKTLKKTPIQIAEEIKKAIEKSKHTSTVCESVDIAGPGFINITLKEEIWGKIAKEILHDTHAFFKLDETEQKKSFLIEYVSANPTGPLHLGHGRGGIIGDVLANVLSFLGHKAYSEFYINDAGNQITKCGSSLKARCGQALGEDVEFPDDGYAGDYLIDLAQKLVAKHGRTILEKDVDFFAEYAKEQMLELIMHTLEEYGIKFDRWFSELSLHKDGSIDTAIEMLKQKGLAYEKEDATWFKSTEFGDDKDRVIRKSDGTLTYIAADIAYHKNKFDRGYDTLIDVLGQDHHGYIKRLKGTMKALGYDSDELDVVLCQVVSIKQGGEQVKMSKRAGTFEKLSDIIEKVGTDVARFFYLNRKADAHLDFDLDVALKKTEENPVFYIQYAYVRTNSLLGKAQAVEELREVATEALSSLGATEIQVIKKICSLESLLKTIAQSYQTHLLSYYTLELARTFHTYYAGNKIIDEANIETSKNRLLLTKMVQQTLALCLELLGLSKPKRM